MGRSAEDQFIEESVKDSYYFRFMHGETDPLLDAMYEDPQLQAITGTIEVVDDRSGVTVARQRAFFQAQSARPDVAGLQQFFKVEDRTLRPAAPDARSLAFTGTRLRSKTTSGTTRSSMARSSDAAVSDEPP